MARSWSKAMRSAGSKLSASGAPRMQSPMRCGRCSPPRGASLDPCDAEAGCRRWWPDADAPFSIIPRGRVVLARSGDRHAEVAGIITAEAVARVLLTTISGEPAGRAVEDRLKSHLRLRDPAAAAGPLILQPKAELPPYCAGADRVPMIEHSGRAARGRLADAQRLAAEQRVRRWRQLGVGLGARDGL